MKPAILAAIICALSIFACDSRTFQDEVKESIPGTYIRSTQHEYGTEHDTVVIILQNETVNEYKLTRRWKYERVLDGKPIEPEYKSTSTTAVYDAKAGMLKETETGDGYTFDTKEKVMFAGSTKYQKLK